MWKNDSTCYGLTSAEFGENLNTAMISPPSSDQVSSLPTGPNSFTVNVTNVVPDPEHARGHAGVPGLLLGQEVFPVGHRVGMLQDALDPAQRHGQAEDADILDQRINSTHIF
ncbi:hypothetical protein PoB_005925900 [Plakobranchus ocellatus]|uniref:Uncharacterized protein n=1 Tax=Plakobranchus ocellatus TaxID=259542 RepID=A0AAV4CMS0_9GAST|nr:hypothetical protein PoB_005925900 [Plakobranchus ocellatus]